MHPIYERTISWGLRVPNQPSTDPPRLATFITPFLMPILISFIDDLLNFVLPFHPPSPSAKTFYLVCSLHNDALLQDNFADRLRHPMRQYL